MPQISDDLYQVILSQSIGNNTMQNVFWYVDMSSGTGSAIGVWNAFDSDIMPILAPRQHSNVNYDSLTVIPVFDDGLEYTAVPSTTAGTQVGTPLPAFMVASIRLARSSRELRSGWKRFSGITEDIVSSPGFTTTYMTGLQTLADALAGDIDNAGPTYRPHIVRKPMTTKAQEAFYRAIPVSAGVALDRVTSQNSRKTF